MSVPCVDCGEPITYASTAGVCWSCYRDREALVGGVPETVSRSRNADQRQTDAAGATLDAAAGGGVMMSIAVRRVVRLMEALGVTEADIAGWTPADGAPIAPEPGGCAEVRANRAVAGIPRRDPLEDIRERRGPALRRTTGGSPKLSIGGVDYSNALATGAREGFSVAGVRLAADPNPCGEKTRTRVVVKGADGEVVRESTAGTRGAFDPAAVAAVEAGRSLRPEAEMRQRVDAAAADIRGVVDAIRAAGLREGVRLAEELRRRVEGELLAGIGAGLASSPDRGVATVYDGGRRVFSYTSGEDGEIVTFYEDGKEADTFWRAPGGRWHERMTADLLAAVDALLSVYDDPDGNNMGPGFAGLRAAREALR